MYNESVLIDRLREKTGYSVELSSGTNIDMMQNMTLPRIYVGHLAVKVERPGDWFADAYRENDNNLVLLSEINYICERNMLAEVYNNIRNAYQGWSPFPNDANYSSLTYGGSMFKGGTDQRVWWADTVGLIFPRIS